MTSTEQEKTEGLKRAYAQVILKTTKEAAARVMAAEFRARRLEKQLALTTDEATRMLVRLKQMLDDEIKQAKSASLNLQQKIDELECQLNEAEGIVIDLRAELQQVQQQLVEEKNKKQLPTGCNKYEELYNFATNGNNSNHGLFTPSLDALPELIIGNDKTLRPNVDVDDHCRDPGERASTLQGEEETNPAKDYTVSVIRKSQRKRKLKVWDDVMTTLGLRRSGQCKKPRQTVPSLSSCTTSMVEPGVESDDEDHEPLVEGAEVEIEENANNLPEKKELIGSENKLGKQEEVAATLAELSSSETEDETGGGCGETTPSKFNHARRKLFKYAIGRKWKNLSTIYPENGSSEQSSSSKKE